MFARPPENIITKLPPSTPETIRAAEEEIAVATQALDAIHKAIRVDNKELNINSPELSKRIYPMLVACTPIIECVGERLRASDPLWARADRLKDFGNTTVGAQPNDRRRTAELEAVIQRYGELLYQHSPEEELLLLTDPSTKETELYFPFTSGAALRRDLVSYQESFTFLQREEAIDMLDDAIAERRKQLEPEIIEYKRMREQLQHLKDLEQKQSAVASS